MCATDREIGLFILSSITRDQGASNVFKRTQVKANKRQLYTMHEMFELCSSLPQYAVDAES